MPMRGFPLVHKLSVAMASVIVCRFDCLPNPMNGAFQFTLHVSEEDVSWVRILGGM
jgi:hypothetical protein